MKEKIWRHCAICKKEIHLGAVYQKCSVSTCKKQAYCSVTCWDTHLPFMNHKTAWAEEARAPKVLEVEKTRRRKIISTQNLEQKEKSPTGLVANKEILVVASKLKAYIKENSGMNTSANVLEALSDIIRQRADDAIYKARRDGRKTVMNKDFY